MTHKLLLSKVPATGGGFDPLDFSFGISTNIHWAEGPETADLSYTDGANATVWPDENTDHAAASDFDSTPATLPIYRATGLGGKPAFEISNFWTADPGNGLGNVIPQPFTWYAVVDFTGGVNVQRIFSSQFGNVTVVITDSRVAGNPINIYSDSVGEGIVLSQGWDDGPFALSVVFDGASSFLHVNGELVDAPLMGADSHARGWNLQQSTVAYFQRTFKAASEAESYSFQQWASDHYGITIA